MPPRLTASKCTHCIKTLSTTLRLQNKRYTSRSVSQKTMTMAFLHWLQDDFPQRRNCNTVSKISSFLSVSQLFFPPLCSCQYVLSLQCGFSYVFQRDVAYNLVSLAVFESISKLLISSKSPY